jgi:chromate transporter
MTNTQRETAAREEVVCQRPQSLGDLFLSFSWLAIQGFGGVLAVAQRELVEKKRWLTREEFIEEWAVAQIMPGPNMINMSIMLGGRHFGWRGSVAAVAGMLTVPMVMIMLLALVYGQFSQHPAVAGALRGMGAVAAGLITATGLKLIPGLKGNVLGRAICLLLGLGCLLAIAGLRLPLVSVLLVLGAIGMTLAYRRLQA